jgi:hypothetical protein
VSPCTILARLVAYTGEGHKHVLQILGRVREIGAAKTTSTWSVRVFIEDVTDPTHTHTHSSMVCYAPSHR